VRVGDDTVARRKRAVRPVRAVDRAALEIALALVRAVVKPPVPYHTKACPEAAAH
jgi:hypothetical protein